MSKQTREIFAACGFGIAIALIVSAFSEGSIATLFIAALFGYLFGSMGNGSSHIVATWGDMTEEKVSSLLTKAGEAKRAEISQHIDAGRNLAAVKALYDKGSVPLRDAKNCVEWMINHRGM